MPNQNDSKDQIRQQMLARNDPAAAEPVHKPQVARKPYQFLLIPVLREYITHEFAPERPLPFAYDLERVIDDFGAAKPGYVHIVLILCTLLSCRVCRAVICRCL